MIAIVIGVLLISAMVVFGTPSTEQVAIFTPTAVSTGTPLPTLTPTQVPLPTETLAATPTINIPLGTFRPSTGVIKRIKAVAVMESLL